MSVIESIELIDKLVKAKMPPVLAVLASLVKQTATELIDFVEKNQSQSLKKDIEKLTNDVNWLKWIMSGLLALFLGQTSLMLYLHGDLKSDIQKIEGSLKSDIQKVESSLKSDIRDINQKLDRLLRK